MQRDTIIKQVKEAGIVGAGGGGFPAYKKMDCQVDTVIANGAECEPVLSTERHLMQNCAAEIVRGLRYVKYVTGARNAYIGVKEKYTEAVETFKKAVGESSDIELWFLQNYYPAGDEFELVYNVTGRIIPESGLPIDVGCVVINVNTLLNITLAVEKSLPVTTRWVTVAGELAEPYLAEVPLGISAGELVDIAKPLSDDFIILAGGPMMGESVEKNYRIDKTCGGLLVLPPDHPLTGKQTMSLRAHKRRGKSTCDQCFDCTIVCPRNLLGHALEPHKVMRQLFIAPENAFEYTPAYLCSECGLCDMYACPLDLSPRRLLQEVGEKLRVDGVKNTHCREVLEPHSEKEFRKVNAERLAIRIGVDDYERQTYEIKKIETDKVVIDLTPKIGKSALPVVKKGDTLVRGDVIGEIPPDALGMMVHASIDGRVTHVSRERVEITGKVQ